MKKGLYLIAFLCFGSALFAQDVAQSQEVASDSVRIKGVHPWSIEQNVKGIKDTTAHWSIIPRIGFNAFDGDFTSEMKHNVAIPSAGLALEYNFTPVWSIGIEYMYNQYTVTGKTGDGLQNADTLLNGHQHRAGAYVAIDVINLFFPRANKKIFSLHPYVGAGGAWYKRSAYYKDDKYYDAAKSEWVNDTHARGNTSNYINADGEVGPEHDKNYKMVGYLQAGLDLDFNLNRTLALGLRANYTYFTRDYIDGRGYHKQSSSSYASKNNDGIFDITLNLRFKLEAVKKSHVRNMPSFDAFDKMLAAAQPQVVPHDTVIIYRHDSIIVRETRVEEKMPPRIYNVYFDNDKDELRQDALTTIQEASMAMEDDPSLYAVVIGYCDNTGSKAHNYELGDRRSNNVSDELQQEYGIPADHVYNAGVGKIAARKSANSFGPNRRVSIHLVDKETFELMKLELNDKSENRSTDEDEPVTIENAHSIRMPRLNTVIEEKEQYQSQAETVPLEESAKKEESLIQEYQTRNHDTVTVEKGMTLSKLARKYYNNTQCWVYIYIANSDKMASPNNCQEGMQLIIPELTKEELQINTTECLRLYAITARKNAKSNP